MKYHFISLGTRCTNLFLLGDGKTREFKGPVDNTLCTSANYLEKLFTNTFMEIFNNIEVIEVDKHKAYKAQDIIIIHNNPIEEKFINEMQSRISTFNNFLEKTKTDSTYYFLFCFNEYFLDKKTRQFTKEFIKAFELFKKYNLLNHIIFVGTRHRSNVIGHHAFWDFWSDKFNDYIKKYNLKYIEIDNLRLSFSEFNKIEFKNKLAKIGIQI